MQELIIFFLIAFVIVSSLLLKSSYSFDDEPVKKSKKMRAMENYQKQALIYNIKNYEYPPLYIDQKFGSASGGNDISIH